MGSYTPAEWIVAGFVFGISLSVPGLIFAFFKSSVRRLGEIRETDDAM